MAERGLTRRQMIGAGLAAFAAVELVPRVADAASLKPTFALDPTGNGRCGTDTCAHCRACRGHGANKLFLDKETADKLRAHKGCSCTVTDGQQLSEAVWTKVFAGDVNIADRRDPATAALLRAEVERHSVPLVSGPLPILALVGGAAGILLVAARRHQEPPATT